jgi:hypothetical protein
MRIVVAGDKDWCCPDLAARILRRLVARYGHDIVIIHGNEPGVDASFAASAKELGITAEARVIERKNTGFPMVGQRNRELLLGGADICLAVHNHVASCPRTLDCVLQALQDGIPTYGIENEHAIPQADQARGFKAPLTHPETATPWRSACAWTPVVCSDSSMPPEAV